MKLINQRGWTAHKPLAVPFMKRTRGNGFPLKLNFSPVHGRVPIFLSFYESVDQDWDQNQGQIKSNRSLEKHFIQRMLWHNLNLWVQR